jgi:hypothetical protein
MAVMLNGVIGPEVMWGDEPKNGAVNNPKNPNTIFVRHRYFTAADRDRVWLTLVAQIAARGPVAGSYIEKHDCTHDSPGSGPCVTGQRNVF